MALMLEGVGMGCVMASNMIAIQASVRHEDIGKCQKKNHFVCINMLIDPSFTIAVVSGLGAYLGLLGANFGVATASAILNTLLTKNLPRVMPMEYAQRIFDSPQYVYNGLPAEYFDAAIEVYTTSFTYLWYTVTACASVGKSYIHCLVNIPLNIPPFYLNSTPLFTFCQAIFVTKTSRNQNSSQLSDRCCGRRCPISRIG